LWVRRPLRPDVLLAFALAALVLSGGCKKEWEEVFEGGEEFRDVREQMEERHRQEQAAEARREAALEAKVAAAMRPDKAFGKEPVELNPKVRWMIQHRLACKDAECTDKWTERIKGLGNVEPALLPLLADQTMPILIEAVRLIGLLEYKTAGMAVTELLAHKQTRVRRAAASTLRWLKNPDTALPIITRLRVVKRPDEQSALLNALAGMQTPVALKALRTGALSSDLSVAMAAVRALSERHDDELVPIYKDVINTAESPPVKMRALEALATNPSKLATTALKRAARSRDPAIKAKAKELLKGR